MPRVPNKESDGRGQNRKPVARSGMHFIYDCFSTVDRRPSWKQSSNGMGPEKTSKLSNLSERRKRRSDGAFSRSQKGSLGSASLDRMGPDHRAIGTGSGRMACNAPVSRLTTKLSDGAPAARPASGRSALAQKVMVRARAPALYGSGYEHFMCPAVRCSAELGGGSRGIFGIHQAPSLACG